MITDKIIKPYVNKKANLSDWNGGWWFLENKWHFTACDVSLTEPSLTNGKAMTPRPAEWSSQGRWKRQVVWVDGSTRVRGNQHPEW